jgi:hypothetical protein
MIIIEREGKQPTPSSIMAAEFYFYMARHEKIISTILVLNCFWRVKQFQKWENAIT